MLFTFIFSLVFSSARYWKTLTFFVSLVFCWGIEFLQLNNLTSRWTEDYPILYFLFGSRFDDTDLPWYALGILLALVVIPRSLGKIQRVR